MSDVFLFGVLPYVAVAVFVVGVGWRHAADRRSLTTRFEHVAADHTGVVETIRSGWAQAGVCIRLCAVEAGLGFLAVREEDYDLCYRCDQEDDPRVRALFNAVRSLSFRRSLGELPGYDAGETGVVAAVTG